VPFKGKQKNFRNIFVFEGLLENGDQVLKFIYKLTCLFYVEEPTDCKSKGYVNFPRSGANFAGLL
jgi:hypothetical protein